MMALGTANLLLFIYLITMLGSNLTTVSAFLSIESTLGSIDTLAYALSLRTAGFFVFGYITPYFLNKFGEKQTLLLAQFFGFFALGLLWAGFRVKHEALIYLGIVASGLPGNVMMITTVATLKHLISEPMQFRKISARREFLAGFTLAFAGLACPFLLDVTDLETVFLIDAFTYGVALIGLLFLKLAIHTPNSEFPLFPHPRTLLASGSSIFLLAVSGPLLLMAFLPMVASSAGFRSAFDLPSNLFRSMWAIEGIVAIIASTVYSKIFLKYENKPIKIILALNGVFLIPLLLPINPLIKFLSICLVPLSFSIAFFNARDTLLISAKEDRVKTNYFASLGSLTRSTWGTLSPLFLTLGFKHTSAPKLIFTAILFQVVFLVGMMKNWKTADE